jgi:hypothetical protein
MPHWSETNEGTNMNMSINGVSAGGHAGVMMRPPAQMQQAMQPVADKLGLTTDELGKRVEGGESLSQIAKKAGVSQTDLEAAITSAIEKNAPAGMTPPAGMAHMIATQAGPPPSMDDVKARFSQALAGVQGSGATSGTDISSLLDALMKGDDADETAKSHGLKTDDLLNLLKKSTSFSTYA